MNFTPLDRQDSSNQVVQALLHPPPQRVLNSPVLLGSSANHKYRNLRCLRHNVTSHIRSDAACYDVTLIHRSNLIKMDTAFEVYSFFFNENKTVCCNRKYGAKSSLRRNSVATKTRNQNRWQLEIFFDSGW